MKNKRSFVSISNGALALIIISLILVGFVITFIAQSFEKSRLKLEEILSNEPEPPIPSASQPITISRENIKTEPGKEEVIKFAVFNPTAEDWVFRDALSGGECGDDTDLICFIDNSDTTGTCNNYQNAKISDTDCGSIDFTKRLCCVGEDCGDDGICLINTENCKKGEDPDCAPQEGVQLSLACDDKLTGKTFQYNTKVIKAREYENFHAIIETKGNAPTKSYLCQLNVLGGSNKYTKDIILEVE